MVRNKVNMEKRLWGVASKDSLWVHMYMIKDQWTDNRHPLDSLVNKFWSRIVYDAASSTMKAELSEYIADGVWNLCIPISQDLERVFKYFA